jgi:hypothetical protein
MDFTFLLPLGHTQLRPLTSIGVEARASLPKLARHYSKGLMIGSKNGEINLEKRVRFRLEDS